MRSWKKETQHSFQVLQGTEKFPGALLTGSTPGTPTANLNLAQNAGTRLQPSEMARPSLPWNINTQGRRKESLIAKPCLLDQQINSFALSNALPSDTTAFTLFQGEGVLPFWSWYFGKISFEPCPVIHFQIWTFSLLPPTPHVAVFKPPF